MVDENKKDAQEYELSGEDYSDLYGNERSKGGLLVFFKRRRILSLVILIFLVFGIYKFASMFFEADDADTFSGTTTTGITKKPDSTLPSTTTTTTLPKVTPPLPPPLKQPTSSLPVGSVSVLSSPETAQKMNAINGQLTQLSIAVDTLNARISAMSARLISIDSRVGQIAMQMLAQANAKRTQQERLEKAQQKSLPVYYTRAIIPGRAWIKPSHGKTITVGVGDSIPGYGTVTHIDVQRGIVVTSKGIIIRYAIDES